MSDPLKGGIMSTLSFAGDMARLQRAIAESHDLVVRRGIVLETLNLRTGERILDSSPENHRPEESNNVKASGGKQVDDLLDGFVGAVVGGFEFAGRLVSDVGAVMETAVGKRAAEPLVEEQEEQRHLDPFRCEAIGVAGAIALQQAVALELAQVVAELVQAVGPVGEVEAGKNGVVDLFGGPAAEMSAAMQEDFKEADQAGVVDLDPGIANRTDGDRKGEALQQREVDMDIEPLCLEGSEAPGDGLEALAHRLEVVQSFLEAEIGEIIGDQLVAQEGEELFVLLQEGILEVGAKDMVAVVDAIDDGGELAVHSPVHPSAEDLSDFVRRQPPQAELAAAFEQLVDGEVALEDEVATILDLGDRIKA